MRKALSLTLAAIMLLTLVSCKSSSGGTAPLTVNGVELDGEIFRYFLNEAWLDETLTTKEERTTRATHLCIRYVAVNSTFTQAGLSLSAAESAQTYEQGNALWQLFGNYYKSIGVSKESYLKIRISGRYTEKLRTAFFDKGGPDEISDAALRGCLAENYVAFKLIQTQLSTTDVYGNPREYTEEELSALRRDYTNGAQQINSGTSIDLIYSSLAASSKADSSALESVVIDENDHKYPQSFFSEIKNIENGKAQVLEDGNYIYIIYRVNILTDATVFDSYRDECLKLLSEAPLQSKINVMCNAYTSVRNPQLVDEYYNDILRVKQNG